MRELDHFTIEQIGIPGSVLMENAGVAVVREIETRWPGARVVVVSGYGNNGGDGLVIARHLLNAGWQVSVWVVGDERKMTKDCLAQLRILQSCSYSFSF
ncbi:MAG TPA: bifunctional ADP-dependent NAD(P)H-hydrate dehydratase/NAD(P)H-hydrate epimerase, partial [Paenibacillaceae bacterium]|nr:bifunctional ADP-dependent NAD(P)H-hydrate dehydratase/NAD(P)H-hydrate epimerase [Paenibacillaceae bacterium]